MLQRSLLFSLHQQLHATFTTSDAWEIPAHYGDAMAECATVRQAVGLFDLSHRGAVEVTGAERASFLHGLTTNDVKRLTAAGGVYAMFLNNQAKILADAYIVALEAAHWLLLHSASLAAKVLRLLDQYHFGEDVAFTDRTGTWAQFALQGPRAQTVLEALGAPIGSLEDLGHAAWIVADHPARVIRCSLTGERGYLLLTDAMHGAALWQRLLTAGQTHGVRPAGGDALDVLRIEAGIPWYGRDMDETTLQPETGLSAAVSETKGCYVGQEIIARVVSRGHIQRQLAGLRIEGSVVPRSGDRVCHQDRDAGVITSAAYSPTLKEPIALAYVQRSAQAPGALVEIRSQTAVLRARVTTLPFVTRSVPGTETDATSVPKA